MANPLAYPPQGFAFSNVPYHLSMAGSIQYKVCVDGDERAKRSIHFKDPWESREIARLAVLNVLQQRPRPYSHHLIDQGWHEIVIAEQVDIQESSQTVCLQVERSGEYEWGGGWMLGGAKLKWLRDVGPQ